MIRGGGLLRFMIGDNSPEGQASAQYILSGTYAEDMATDEDDELEYERVNTLPERLYLIAQGFIPEEQETEESLTFDDDQEEIAFRSRRFLLVELRLGGENDAGYELEDMVENASGELVDRILTYGVPDEE